VEGVELFSKFESIGDNCEFAFAQRQAGVDQPSLLRWASIPSVDCLVNVFQKDFEGLFEFDNIRPFVGGLVKDVEFQGIAFHSGLTYTMGKENSIFTQPEEERRATHAREKQKLSYLTEKTLGHLRSSERIFLFKRNDDVSDADAVRLYEQVKRFNEANVLVVVRAGRAKHETGSLVPLSERLLIAYIDRFAPYDKSTEVSQDGWRKVLTSVTSRVQSDR
jgi:hypothetical protein